MDPDMPGSSWIFLNIWLLLARSKCPTMLGPDLAPLLPDYPHPGTPWHAMKPRSRVGDFLMDFLFKLGCLGWAGCETTS